MIAAVSAVFLFIVMFLSWFGVDIPDEAVGLIAAADLDTSANAWQAFGFIDIVLFVTIIVAIGAAVMKANAQSVNLPVAMSALVAGLGALCVILVLFRVIDPPGDGGISRKIGLFLGLIGSVGIAYGGYLSMQEEGTSFQGEADRLQNRGGGSGGAPPPPPPPASTPPAAPPPPRDPGSNPPPGV
jgi:hypothetical protein